MKKISVVIPCYNSQNYLKSTVDRICNLLKGKDYEIILVNDCSSDSTIDTIVSIVNENNNILGIDLAHNTGQHNATMAGFHYVTGDYVLTCADDGQSPIEKWDEMIKALDSSNDSHYQAIKNILPILFTNCFDGLSNSNKVSIAQDLINIANTNELFNKVYAQLQKDFNAIIRG